MKAKFVLFVPWIVRRSNGGRIFKFPRVIQNNSHLRSRKYCISNLLLDRNFNFNSVGGARSRDSSRDGVPLKRESRINIRRVRKLCKVGIKVVGESGGKAEG